MATENEPVSESVTALAATPESLALGMPVTAWDGLSFGDNCFCPEHDNTRDLESPEISKLFRMQNYGQFPSGLVSLKLFVRMITATLVKYFIFQSYERDRLMMLFF